MPEPTTPEGAEEPKPSAGSPSAAPGGATGAPGPEQVPSASQAQPAPGPARGPSGGPAGQPTAPIPPAGPPTQPMPTAYAPGAGVPGQQPARPGMWKQATSTTGGLIAVILAGGLAVVLLLGLIGTGLLVATRIANHDDRGDGIAVARGDRQDQPPGLRKKLQEKAPGPRADGQGRGGLGNGNGMDNGLGPLMRAAMALGNVQHGEFTVTDAAGKATVMTLQRGEVTKVSDTSISLKSADNFAGTYAVGADTAGRAGDVAVGDTVLVVAEKAGSKAVLVAATRRG